MNLKKSAAALLAICISAASLAGCSQSTPQIAATYNGGEIPAGVYITEQVNAMNEATTLAEGEGSDILKKTIDGVSVEQWVNDRARNLVKTYVGVSAEAERLGVAVDETTAAAVEGSIANSWQSEGASFEKLGISQRSFLSVALNSQLSYLVFNAYYGEGGEQEVPEEELKSFFTDNYRRSMMLVINYIDTDTNEPLAGDELAAQKAVFEGYKKRAEAGESVFALLEEENRKIYDENKANDAAQTEEYVPLVEAQQEMLVSKSSSTLPLGLNEMLFASQNPGVEFYEDDDYGVIFERRDTMGDGTAFTNAKVSLLNLYKNEEFRAAMQAAGETQNVVFNDSVIAKFKVEKLLEQ